jgi:hemoglobin
VQTPYDILGKEGIERLADAFYDVMDELPQAAHVRAMHAQNLDQIKRKLCLYLTGWMGGPPVYLATYGSVCLTDAHAPYRIGATARDQWLMCMDEALNRIGASEELIKMLHEPMRRIAEAVRNDHISGVAEVVDRSAIIARG